MKKDVALLLIDPQRDFHEGGSLAVPGASSDTQRLASLIEAHADQIDGIFVTLDSHHVYDISHPSFWVDANGNPPAPFTPVPHSSVKDGVWSPVDTSHQAYCEEYTAELERRGRFTHFIWPEHCLIGSEGHNVQPCLDSALRGWAKKRRRNVHFVHKGEHHLCEMYSCFAAEVPLDSAPETALNTSLLAEMQGFRQILVGGQALSHCVNYSTRDLVAFLKEKEKDKGKGKAGTSSEVEVEGEGGNGEAGQDGGRDGSVGTVVMLLKDASSSVPGFEAAGEEFLADMERQGVKISSCAEVLV